MKFYNLGHKTFETDFSFSIFWKIVQAISNNTVQELVSYLKAKVSYCILKTLEETSDILAKVELLLSKRFSKKLFQQTFISCFIIILCSQNYENIMKHEFNQDSISFKDG